MYPTMTKILRNKLLWIPSCVVALSIGTIPAAAQEPLFGLDLANHLANSEQWPMFGQNQMNTATSLNRSPSPMTVGKLAPKWTFKTGGDVSARAAVVVGIAYFPDWATPTTSSNLWALATCTYCRDHPGFRRRGGPWWSLPAIHGARRPGLL